MLMSDIASPQGPGYTKAHRAHCRPPCPQETQLHDGQPLPPKISLEGLPDPRVVLTNRQLLIFALTAAGFTAAEIGQQLCCSHRTVETHRDHIGKRLRVNSKLDLWRLALRHHLVTLDRPLIPEEPR